MYDFDTLIPREGMNSLKWDVREGELPMWVADMDFATAPEITRAVMEKAARGVFGYGVVPPEFSQTIRSWWARRYGWEMSAEWVSNCTGIVPAVASLVRTFVEAGKGVVMQSPAYNCFYDSIRNSSRVVLANDLVQDGKEFRIDWADLEAKLADIRAKVLLLCNPHNPTGAIWSEEDLARMGEMAADNGVIVISDEIHCDITEPGTSYTPFASVNDLCARNSITLVAPTKSFSIPGLQTSAVIIPDPDLRAEAVAGLKRDELTEPNSFAVEALIAAYTNGEDWLDQMRAYVFRNKAYFADSVDADMPELDVVPSQATYLTWVDCGSLTEDATEFCDFLREKTGLIVNPGAMYGDNTRTFLRINLGCPRSRVEDALSRLAHGISDWKAQEFLN